MKKFYTLFTVATAASLLTVANAQQLPNAGFEDAWNISVPWTSDGNQIEMGANLGQEYEGEPLQFNIVKAYNPASWCISHVIGISGLGSTVTGEKVEGGYGNSSSAVKIVNAPNSLLATQIVPGYITLGTTWSTSVMGSENDGGSFGSIAFTYRPDAIAFQYKRTHGVAGEEADEGTQATYKPDEPATVVAYLWKGQWSQAEVPGSIAIFGAPATSTMTDRDRNILGMTTAKGGEVTKTEGSELIASLNYSITGNAADWTYFEQPLEYVSDAAPEKINVVLAANDYFAGAEAVGRDNSLTVDDIKLVYYSRLNGVKVNGTNVENFDSKTYAYNVPGSCPDSESAFELEVLGKSAQTSVTIDKANNAATVKVSNVDADSDGLKEHTYTFNFVGAEQSAVKYVGTLVVAFGVDTTIPNSELYITPTGANTCTISLYNFSFMGMNVGDIVVEGVQTTTAADGTISYSGSKEGLSLMGGNMIVNVTVDGTETPDGKLTMSIPVQAPVGEVGVTFNGQKDTSSIDSVIDDENAPVEYFNLNGIRVDSENLAPGIYVKRQGRKVSKVLIRK